MNKLIAMTLLASSVLVAGPALAESASCTTKPKTEWMSRTALKAKIKDMGFKLRSMKREGSCYEIYAFNKKGKRVESLLNPVTAALVRDPDAD
jgi:hypothetical protein